MNWVCKCTVIDWNKMGVQQSDHNTYYEATGCAPGYCPSSWLCNVCCIQCRCSCPHEQLKLHAFFTSALDGDEWLFSRPGCSYPRGKNPGTHWIGGWVSPKAGLDIVAKRKMLPCWKSNPGRPAPSLVNILTELWAHCLPMSFTHALLFK
jgi:hypothetical protein